MAAAEPINRSLRLVRSYKMYKLLTHPLTGELDSMVLRLADLAFIPFDPGNVDYQIYLKWLAEGNQPLPADNSPRSEA